MTSLESLKTGNTRVEGEKSGEISYQRKLTIIVSIYIVIILVFSSFRNLEIFLNVIIPTIGYRFSTLSTG